VRFDVTVLGCAAALPSVGRNTTAQLVNIHEKRFLVDCGETTQVALRAGINGDSLRMMRIDRVFISHLHGDHYLGLPGLIATFNLMGRTRALTVYGPPDLERLMLLHQEVSGARLNYPLNFVGTSMDVPVLLWEDASVEVHSFPVKHRIPTTGFLFREKRREPGVKHFEVKALSLTPSEILHLKKRQDVLRSNGQTLAWEEICVESPPSRSYAFAADTLYWERVVEAVQGVDLLYHEATFMAHHKALAVKTYHSTTTQAANVAAAAGVRRLLIGHLSARYKDVRAVIDEVRLGFADAELARDGVTYSIEQQQALGTG
jgi:ribonuclease Z